jgi:putative tryptophan/tyrosine transport system substrate-binding protein
MDRRTLIRGLSTLAVLAPIAAYSQTLAKAARVGLLMTTTPVAASHIVVAFADGLRALGYIEGKNLVLEYRWAEGRPERLDELAADLVQQPVDVIVASSQAAALAAKRATTTIPIVMVNATDPVEAALVSSLARPGGNVTGLSQQLTPEICAKQLQLLKEVLTKAVRVAVLRSSATTVALRDYEAAGRTLELQVKIVNVRDRDDLKRAFATMARERVDALVVPADPFLFTGRLRVVEGRVSTGYRRCARPGSSSRPGPSCPTRFASANSSDARHSSSTRSCAGPARRPFPWNHQASTS